MLDTLRGLYDIILSRKGEHIEGSYTCYLFEQGLDKILKKVGEESAETIISAKNGDIEAITLETCDLLYHLLVMLVQTGVSMESVERELAVREKKQGNLKTFKKADKNT